MGGIFRDKYLCDPPRFVAVGRKSSGFLEFYLEFSRL